MTARDIPGWEGMYQATPEGRIVSVRRGKVVAVAPGGRNGRYLRVQLYNGKRRSFARVHCLVAAAFLGRKPEGMEVCHRDHNAHNNRADNLEYGTKEDNLLDRDVLRWELENADAEEAPF